MSLNSTVSAERLHISFFGLRNAGKSSLVNAVTGQQLAVVSEVLGTTTDPVSKAMELLPIGPVVIIDTAGIDDEGELGELRVQKTMQVLSKTDIAVLVTDCTSELNTVEKALIEQFKNRNIPFLIAYNKTDLLNGNIPNAGEEEIYVSAKSGYGVTELKKKIADISKQKGSEKRVIADLLNTGDTVVLVIPIDEAAPKGRLILPQQQTIRDILDAGCTAVCCRDIELAQTLNSLAKPPKIVVTDSQAFGKVAKIIPQDMPLTSFSVLFARYKGDLSTLAMGAKQLSSLKDNDRVLISEGCTHHRQCGDIGTVKLPNWIRQFCGCNPQFEFTSGGDFPNDLSPYSLIVHCGGCMLNEREMQSRIQRAKQANVPIINYGIAIAHIHGILKRSLSPFEEISQIL